MKFNIKEIWSREGQSIVNIEVEIEENTGQEKELKKYIEKWPVLTSEVDHNERVKRIKKRMEAIFNKYFNKYKLEEEKLADNIEFLKYKKEEKGKIEVLGGTINCKEQLNIEKIKKEMEEEIEDWNNKLEMKRRRRKESLNFFCRGCKVTKEGNKYTIKTEVETVDGEDMKTILHIAIRNIRKATEEIGLDHNYISEKMKEMGYEKKK